MDLLVTLHDGACLRGSAQAVRACIGAWPFHEDHARYTFRMVPGDLEIVVRALNPRFVALVSEVPE